MIKHLLLTLLLIFALCAPAWALDVIPGVKGWGSDTRASYAGLTEHDNLTVTFADANPDTISATGIHVGLVAGDTIEIEDSTDNNDVFMIASVATGVLTLVAGDALTAEGPTANVEVYEKPTICVVDSLTLDDAAANSTRNGVPVKTGGLETFLDWKKDNKLIIFEVSGVMTASKILKIASNGSETSNSVMISGQTAPSPGVNLHHTSFRIGVDDFVMQHMRIRTGDETTTWTDAPLSSRDSLAVLNPDASYCDINPNYVVIDSCSLAWGVDELIAFNRPNASSIGTILVNNCLLGEGFESAAVEDDMAKVALSRAYSANFLGNLMVSNRRRMPFSKDNYHTIAGNVIYNPTEFNIMMDTREYSTHVAVVGNVILDGPTTLIRSQAVSHTPTFMASNTADLATGSEYYFMNNRSGSNNPTLNDASDWTYVYNHGVKDIINYRITTEPAGWWASGYTAPTITTTNDFQTLVDDVLSIAGARASDRDAVDTRLVTEAGSGSISSAGTGGSIKTTNTDVTFPTLAENTRNVGTGMPAVIGIYTIGNIPSDPHGDDDTDGYTNLEEWLHNLHYAARDSIGGSSDDFKAWWKFEDTPGILVDSEGDYTLTDHGTVVNVAGKVGEAADFTPDGDYFTNSGATNDYNWDTSKKCTICAWVNIDNFPGAGEFHQIFSKGTDGGSDYVFSIYVNENGRLGSCFCVNANHETYECEVYGSANMVEDQWYHVCVSINDSGATVNGLADKEMRIRIWDDTESEFLGTPGGDEETPLLDDNWVTDGGGDTHIGSYGAANYWDGMIDEMRAYDDILTADEMDTIRTSATTISKFYHCDAAGDEVAANGGTTYTAGESCYLCIDASGGSIFRATGALSNLQIGTDSTYPDKEEWNYYSGIETGTLIFCRIIQAGDRDLDLQAEGTAEGTGLIHGATTLVDLGGTEINYALPQADPDGDNIIIAAPSTAADPFTIGSGLDLDKISDLGYQLANDIYRYMEPVTDNVDIIVNGVTITGIGRSQLNTGTLTFTGDNNYVRCVRFSGGVTDNGSGNTYPPVCQRGRSRMGLNVR